VPWYQTSVDIEQKNSIKFLMQIKLTKSIFKSVKNIETLNLPKIYSCLRFRTLLRVKLEMKTWKPKSTIMFYSPNKSNNSVQF
jgi:hypothetical protein